MSSALVYKHHTTDTESLGVTWYTAFFLYNIRPIQHLSYTTFVLYTILPILHSSYTTFFLYNILPIHHSSYTAFFLYNIRPIQHSSYTNNIRPINVFLRLLVLK